MLLRLNLALTNFRQLDVTVRDDINAAELDALAHSIANATHGHQDLVTIQCVEELVTGRDDDAVPLLITE